MGTLICCEGEPGFIVFDWKSYGGGARLIDKKIQKLRPLNSWKRYERNQWTQRMWEGKLQQKKTNPRGPREELFSPFRSQDTNIKKAVFR